MSTTPDGEVKPDADLRDRLQQMETKVRKLREVRSSYNESANRFADQRNAIQERYKEHRAELDVKLEERKAVREQIKQHKERRNSMQQQVRDLFSRQRKNRDDVKGGKSVAGEYNKLGAEIENLERVLETSGRITLVKENKMIQDIKDMKRRRSELEPELKQHEIVKVDLSNVDEAIATLKAEADIAHQAMLEQVKISDEMSEELTEMFKERDFLKAEGDKLHSSFVEEKENANGVHEKISDLMAQVTEVRNEINAQRAERKSWLTNHNAAVEAEMRSGADDESVADDLVSQFLDEGNLTVGGTSVIDSSGARSGRRSSKKKSKMARMQVSRGNRGRTKPSDE